MTDESSRLQPYTRSQIMVATSTAKLVIYGGGAGCGKSLICFYEALKLTAYQDARGVRCLGLRRIKDDLRMPGGLWDISERHCPSYGGVAKRDEHTWTFEAASGRLEDRHQIMLSYLDSDKRLANFTGPQFDMIFIDELQYFPWHQVAYLLTRMRGMSGITPRMRASMNPAATHWTRKALRWFIDDDGWVRQDRCGVVRHLVVEKRRGEPHFMDFATAEEALEQTGKPPLLTFTFIQGLLKENTKLLEQNPDYAASFAGLTGAEYRSKFGDWDRGGNWNDAAEPGDYFDPDDFQIVDPRYDQHGRVQLTPDGPWLRIIGHGARAWDRAASGVTDVYPDPDYTSGPRGIRLEGDRLLITDIARWKLSAVRSIEQIESVARDDGQYVVQWLWQDSGGAGKSDAETLAGRLRAHPNFCTVQIALSEGQDQTSPVPARGASRAKRAHARTWTQMARERRIYIQRAPWNQILLTQARAFPNERADRPAEHDDDIDAISLLVKALGLDVKRRSIIDEMQ